MAFLLSTYGDLLRELLEKGFRFGPISAYFEAASPPFIFLRHDVDRISSRAVHMAAAERDLGIKATYYFRCDSHMLFPEEDIRFVVDLGHEIGFRYETVARLEWRTDEVLDRFCQELAALRALADVRTVTAHGPPLSQLPTVRFAKKLDLGKLGIVGDPAVDIDFSKVLYITETGGVFGSRANRRDWSGGKNLRDPTPPSVLGKTLDPGQEPFVVLSTHPERWPLAVVGLVQARLSDLFVNLFMAFAGGGLGRE